MKKRIKPLSYLKKIKLPKASFPNYSKRKGIRIISLLLSLQSLLLFAVHYFASPALHQGLARYKETTGRIALNLFSNDRGNQSMLLELQSLLQWVWIAGILLSIISLWTWLWPQQLIRILTKSKIL
jgi:hypothetical protein